MPENQVTIISIGAAIITSLLAALGIMWRLWDRDRTTHRTDMEEKDQAYLEKTEARDKEHREKTEELNQSIISQMAKSYDDLATLLKENTAIQLNGHDALREDIKDIDDKVNDLDTKVQLIEEKIKNK